MAKASRKRMKSSVSRSEPLTRSVAKRIVRLMSGVTSPLINSELRRGQDGAPALWRDGREL